MVQATINLIEFALNHDKDNEYFHLISGDDVILSKDLIWDDNSIYMEEREYLLLTNTACVLILHMLIHCISELLSEKP